MSFARVTTLLLLSRVAGYVIAFLAILEDLEIRKAKARNVLARFISDSHIEDYKICVDTNDVVILCAR